jgi:long-chain fatty acid transport protein
MMRRATSLALGHAVFALVTSAHSSAVASPQDLFGYGARASAMAGLGGAIVDDFSAVHANPAALSRARDISFTLGYQGAGFAIARTVAMGAPQHVAQDLSRGTVIGLALPLPFGGALRDRIVIGLGFYTPTDVVVRGRILHPETPQLLLLSDRTQTVAVQAGVGVELPQGLRVGGGFVALAAIRGSVVIAQDTTGRVGSRVDNQLVTSYAPIVGVSFEQSIIRTSLTFRGTSVGRFAVTIEARDIGLPLPVFNIAGIAQYDPWQIAGEAGVQHEGWSLLAGLTFKRWSDYPGPLERTTERSPEPPRPAMVDTVVARVAFEKEWARRTQRWALRGGYFYEPTPLPARTEQANYLDNDRHVISLGASVAARWRGSLARFDLWSQLHLLPSRASTDGTMEASLSPTITTSGTIIAAGTQLTVTF